MCSFLGVQWLRVLISRPGLLDVWPLTNTGLPQVRCFQVSPTLIGDLSMSPTILIFPVLIRSLVQELNLKLCPGKSLLTTGCRLTSVLMHLASKYQLTCLSCTGNQEKNHYILQTDLHLIPTYRTKGVTKSGLSKAKTNYNRRYLCLCLCIYLEWWIHQILY